MLLTRLIFISDLEILVCSSLLFSYLFSMLLKPCVFKKGINLFVNSNISVKSKDLGISISCDGVCLTLISKKNMILEFYLSNETLHRTKFKGIKKGDLINLELPLKNGQNHIGHWIDGLARRQTVRGPRRTRRESRRPGAPQD